MEKPGFTVQVSKECEGEFYNTMTNDQNLVRRFMLRAKQACPDKPQVPTLAIQNLRINLIQEELDELKANPKDLVNVADAIADLMYVVLGTAVAYGIDIEPIFDEVHRSNMSKFIDGHEDENGKWKKGPSYTPPDIETILEEQTK